MKNITASLKILLIAFLFYVPYAQGEECRSAYYAQKETAFNICFPQAEKNNVEAQKIIGDMYFWGWGESIARDYKEAVLWYKRAASRKSMEAKYNLGVMYEQGKGVRVDFGRSIQWYRSAAVDGHILAQFNLANMYSKGAGIRQNQPQASMWYLRAAKQGDATSQYNIGNRYASGDGISHDKVEAYKWYLLAENQGDQNATYNREHLKSFMVVKDVQKAEMLAENWRPQIENANY